MEITYYNTNLCKGVAMSTNSKNKDYLESYCNYIIVRARSLRTLKLKVTAPGYLQGGQIYEYVSVQSAWSHKSIVQNICSVSGGKDNHMVSSSHSCREKRVQNYFSV